MNMDEAENPDVYIKRKKTPFKYQEECLEKILNLFRKGINPILNFDTGLGKTFTSLELIRRMKYENALQNEFHIKTILIVCKASNIKDPWIKDINENQMSCLTYAGSQDKRSIFRFENDKKQEQLNIQGYDILLVSYDILANDITYISQTNFDLVIFDEIHNQFNDTKYSANISKITNLNYKFAVALTATPMKNTVYEPYLLACFMKYQQKYNEIRKEFLTEVAEYSEMDPEIFEDIIIKRIKSEFQDYFITISKYHISEESPLPAIHSYKIILPVEDSIRIAVGYDFIMEENFFNRKEHLLTFPENYPAELENNGLPQNIISTKYIALEAIVRKLLAKQEKIIIFSQFVKDLEYLCGKLSLSKPIIITGKYNPKERDDRIKFFNSDNNGRNLLLLSLNAFAEGINLQSANNVIFMNPWYNPSKLSQARDRVYRTGQKKEVNVFFLSTDTQFEKRVWDIHDRKNYIITTLFFDDVKEKLPKIQDIDYQTFNYEKSDDIDQNTNNFIDEFLKTI